MQPATLLKQTRFCNFIFYTNIALKYSIQLELILLSSKKINGKVLVYQDNAATNKNT